MSEVNNYLDDFKQYLTVYKDIVETEAPYGYDAFQYRDFDAYMRKLDPISGFMRSIYDEQKSKAFVDDFLFVY